MKQAVIVLLILAQTMGSAQEPKNAPTETPRVDLGAYASDTYTNECLGIAFHMPAGWVAKSQGVSGLSRAIHHPGGGLGLLMIEQPKQGTFGNTITLYAVAATDSKITAKDFVTNAVRTQISRAPDKNDLLRDTSAVDYGGKHFFRSDYKAALPYGHSAYRAFVFTQFRGYFFGEMLSTGSAEELNRAADSLRGISFLEDVPNPKCKSPQ
jgi:hypothetical protein